MRVHSKLNYMRTRGCAVGVCAAGVVLHVGCRRSAGRAPGVHGVWHDGMHTLASTIVYCLLLLRMTPAGSLKRWDAFQVFAWSVVLLPLSVAADM